MQTLTERPMDDKPDPDVARITRQRARRSRLEFLAEDLAALLYDAERELTGGPRDPREYHELPPASQRLFREAAERCIAARSPFSAARAVSRAVHYALVANDALGSPEWTSAVQTLAETVATDAVDALPHELSRVWREEIGR